MAKFKINNTKKLPEGVKLAKTAKKVKPSSKEFYPLTTTPLGYNFFVPGKTARDLRGVIHTKRRTQGMKFVAETENTKNGYGARVYRVK